MSHLPMEQFARNAQQALGNDTQRAALRAATDLFGQRRQQALAEVPTWDALRDRARAIKDHVLAHLDHYLEQFAESAAQRGVRVHWAEDTAAACSLVTGIARAAAAKLAVKSKSMTTEEIRLSEALAAAGVEAVETDLGEWIVQLAGEVPSHIIVPAIHKTKEQIAALFAERVGTEPGADVEALTRAARVALRQRFAAADLGISGANFAVAETGSLLILENEGNARFTTTLPRVHVAVVGIEKVIPHVADLEVFLALLPRSGTGQRITSYLSLLSGPAGAAGEGPDELHVVLLDNGRSRMLARAVTRQSLACIRCGACLNACPVYQQVGGHAYGSVYPGPIGAVITPQLAGIARGRELPFASSLCGACRDVCPVRIDIPALLLDLRSQVLEGGPDGPPARPRRLQGLAFGLWAWAMAGRRRYRFATAVARLGQRLVAPRGWSRRAGALLRWLVPPLGAWTGGRDLRPLARRSFRDRFRDGDRQGGPT